MAWVILGHTLALNFQIMDNLGYVGPKWVSWTSFQAVENALVSVDTFFAISGLLVSYLLLKEMKKLGGPLKTNWFMFYFHRFWRLTPVYMLIIGMYTCLTKYYSDGPIYPQDEKTPCKQYWWTNLLYINNLVYPNGDAGGGCIAWTWYLANDMQFYILSPLLIVPFYFGAPFGFASSFVFLITTWGATGGLGHKYQWPPTQLGGGPDTSHQGEMFSKYYVKPYCRMGPYIMGVITGYLLYHTQCKLKIRWYLNILGWALATLFASLVLYGLHDAMNGNPLKENVAILYLTTHRTVWGACVCWVVFACVTGNGGPINTLLSWEGFVPLSRLTYCAYLVHPIVMEVYEGSLRHPLDFTILTFSFLFIGYLVCAMSIAFIVSLAFEAPMMGLEKIVFPKGGKKPNAKGGNESNGQTVPNLPIAVLSVKSPTVENVKM
ncbi:hypothetical protein FSP39_005125 [Pinctada imbricata]|uniref:Acyltransferase 3 domain-containing protein n=1 Tax=Pinctada imbricata TaxID=66713 RepID=A0AA88XN59_PINIB|nr:hypothetical protein FSP39_005125 [Pinctada imbricata]